MQTRRAPAAITPTSYDVDTQSVQAVLSVGAAVRREYGREVLEISSAAVDLTRARGGNVPLLDSHNTQGIDSALRTVSDV